MSPTKCVGGAAKQAAPIVVVGDLKRDDGHHLKEKSAAPAMALDKVLAALGYIFDRMNWMEYSQKEQGGRIRNDSEEASTFNSALVVGAGIDLQTWYCTSPRMRDPNDVSPATYFGAR